MKGRHFGQAISLFLDREHKLLTHAHRQAAFHTEDFIRSLDQAEGLESGDADDDSDGASIIRPG